MLRIKKRDESIVDFDLSRIEKAIERAFLAEHKEATKEIIELTALKVNDRRVEKIDVKIK